MIPAFESARQLLRHAVATVAYRGDKALRDTPPHFANFRAAETARTPLELLAHISDLYAWALSISQGKQSWSPVKPLDWQAEVERFFATMTAFDKYLDSDEPLYAPAERLFQGPIADSLTHVGQLALLRRLANSPIRGENYFVADITTGRCGADQAAPRREFY
jgi:hypothetical protein